MTNQLFEILDGVLLSDEGAKGLTVDHVTAYAENGVGVSITDAQAKKIVNVGKKWISEQENGNGEWSRMRHDAMNALEE